MLVLCGLCAIIFYKHKKKPKVETKNNPDSPNMSQGICTDSKFSRNLHSFVILFLKPARLHLSPPHLMCVNSFEMHSQSPTHVLNTNVIFGNLLHCPCRCDWYGIHLVLVVAVYSVIHILHICSVREDDNDDPRWEVSDHKWQNPS